MTVRPVSGRPVVRLSALFVAVTWLAACGGESMVPRTRASPAVSGGNTAATETAGGDGLDATVSVAADSGFGLFCAGVGAIQPEGERVPEITAALCDADGRPRRLFARTLPGKAFDGTGEPVLLRLAEPENDATEKTTAVFVTAAVRLPGAAPAFYEALTRYTGDPDGAKAKGLKIIEGVVEERIIASQAGDDRGFGGSWDKHVVIETKTGGQTIRSEYECRTGLHEIAPGKAYLLTAHLTKSILGVKANTLYAAIVSHGQDTFAVAGIYSKSANRGLPDVARDTLIRVIKQGIRNMHANAAIIAGE